MSSDDYVDGQRMEIEFLPGCWVETTVVEHKGNVFFQLPNGMQIAECATTARSISALRQLAEAAE